MEIEFIEDGHIYVVDGIITPSVSEILHFIFPDKYSNVPKKILENKAEFGTHIHDAIEQYEKGNEFILSPMERVVFEQYLKVKEKYKIEPLEHEKVICYENRYAGRLDMIAMVNGTKSLIDIKTTAQIDYGSLAWQLGMYNEGHKFMYGERFEKTYCLWLPKKDLGALIEIDARNLTEIDKELDNYEGNC